MHGVTSSGIVGHRRAREVVALRRRTLVLLIAIVALVLEACGTRLPNSAFVQSQRSGSGQQALAGDQTGTDQTDNSATAGDTGGGTTGGATNGGTSGGTTGKAGTAGTKGTGTAPGPGGAANGASDVGVTANSIKIGNITSIQGQFGPDAFSPSLYGLQAYIGALNARGGVNGRKIDFHTCDDRDTGDGNLTCAQQLVDQQKVFVMLANNSESSARSASYTNGKGVPDLGLPLNNGYYKYPTMFSFYGNDGYPRNGKDIGAQGKLWQQTGQYRWFKQQRHIDKGAFFYYTIAVSQQQGFAEIANANAEGIEKTYVGGGSDQGENFAAPTFDTDVVNMKSKGVQGIWDAMDTPANQKLCSAMDRGGFTVLAKISTVEVWSKAVGTDFSSPCRNSVYAPGATDPFSNQSDPLVAQFLSDFAKYSPGRTMHEWALEGWAMGYEFTKAAQSMGANLTRAGFIKWLNDLNAYTLDGLTWPHDYKPKDYKAPFHQCFSVAHWNDGAGTFVTDAPIGTCYDAKWISFNFSNDGA
jgi:branched-chain amino acid transport system substrate-binding protein